jgi:transcriptional regulator with XRE-family HTH domain
MGRFEPLSWAALVVVSIKFMSTDFALDLRVARRQAGYTQQDVAMLLGAHQSHVSDLEHGRTIPSLAETVTLSLIFGRSFESLFADLLLSAKTEIGGRITALPSLVRSYVGTFNRDASLKKLERRLAANPPEYGAK